VQVLFNMFRHGMDPQQALEVPRVCLAAGAPDGGILLEEGLEHLVAELTARGHTNIKVVSGFPARLYVSAPAA
jgi:gamma-glutamyltranspeptidase / glutathione hydrolase